MRYKRLPRSRPLRTILGATIVMATQTAFVVWILLPRHWPLANDSPVLYASSLVMLCSIYAIELFRLAYERARVAAAVRASREV